MIREEGKPNSLTQKGPPQGARIEAGLRPDTGAFSYSGNVVVELASDLLTKALRGKYPFTLDSMQGLTIFGEDRQFTSVGEILITVEP